MCSKNVQCALRMYKIAPRRADDQRPRVNGFEPGFHPAPLEAVPSLSSIGSTPPRPHYDEYGGSPMYCDENDAEYFEDD
jgi:hypothetical protein